MPGEATIAKLCSDGRLDGTETDTDCGGPCPTKCPDGDSCEGERDCASGVCADRTCAAPSCSDEVKNGLETDVDCGGGKCAQCAPLAACDTGEDCSSNACLDNRCDAGLRVYYSTDTLGTNEVRVRPQVYLTNEGTNAVELARLSFRYYLTTTSEGESQVTANEGTASQSGAGGGDLTDVMALQVAEIAPAFKADCYTEVTFPQANSSLPPGEELAVVFTLNFPDYAPMTQSNDYSFDAAPPADAPYDRIPLYLDGALIYGAPPDK